MGKKDKQKGRQRPIAHALSDNLWNYVDSVPLQFILAPTDLTDFNSKIWEQQPLHVPSNASRHALFNGLIGLEKLLELARDRQNSAGGPLRFGVDINAARYVNGVRDTPNEEIGDEATLSRLLAGGCTLQLHQPQRWLPDLWRLIAALESQLACLVGSNLYATPAGSQGLAPHHDDVEIFVCQTQGSKTWRLYEPVDGQRLPSQPSGDLDRSQLGPPTMTVTLQEGDVLYMPRGTVHEATANEGPSVHVTISTAQRWSLAHLLPHLLGVSDTAALPLPLRHSLPLGFLQTCGSHVNAPEADTTVVSMATGLGAGLRALADQIEHEPRALLAPAADSLSIDFMTSRAPPHPAQLADQGPPPQDKDRVFCRNPSYFRIVPGDHAATSPASEIKLMSCLRNQLELHMMGHPTEACCDDSDCEDEACGNPHDLHHGDPGHQHPSLRHGAAPDHLKGAPHEEESSDEEEGEEEEEEDKEEGKEDGDESRADLVFPVGHAALVSRLLASSKAAPVRLADLDLPSEGHLVRFLWAEGVLCTLTTPSPQSAATPSGKKRKVTAAAGKETMHRSKKAVQR